MRPWKVYILLQALCLLAYCTEIVSIIPSNEENCLDGIATKKFIPKISLHSLQTDCSIFNHYLQSHTIAVPLKKGELTWTYYLPKKKTNAPVFVENDNLVLSKDFLIQLFDPSPPEEEILSILSPFRSKDFLEDILSTLTKSRQIQEIKALFEPEDNHPEIDLLENYLNNSLEFKVLSHANQKALLLKAEEYTSSSNKIIKLTSSPLSKKIPLSQPKVTKFTSSDQELSLTALLNTQNRPNPSYLKEEERVIDLRALTSSKIISYNNNTYTYIPPEKALPCIITAPSLMGEKINLQMVQTPLAPPLQVVAKMNINHLHSANLSPFPLQEKGEEIILPSTCSPSPLPQLTGAYCYTPTLKTSIAIKNQGGSIEKKASLKRSQGAISIQYIPVAAIGLKESSSEVLFNPNPNVIITPYLSKINSCATLKDPTPSQSIELPTRFKVSNFSLGVSTFKDRSKHYFVETEHDPSFPTKLIKIATLSFNEQHKKALPRIETNITASTCVTCPFPIKSSSIPHYFIAATINGVNGDELFISKTFKSEKVDVIASSKRLNELPDHVYDRPCKEIGATHLEKNPKRYPNKECILNQQQVSLPSLTLVKRPSACPLIESSAFFEDTHFHFAQTRIGRLGRMIEKQSLLFHTESIPKYLEEVAISSIKLPLFKETPSHEEDFSAKAQQFFLPYEYIISGQIHSSITPKVSQKTHLLAVTYSKSDQTKKMSKQLQAITAEKDLPCSQALVDFAPSEDVTISMIPVGLEHFTPLAPSFISNNTIENSPTLSTIICENTIRLPKIEKIRNERSFFLNPMLSLLGSENIDIHSDLIDAAHTTNRSHRMTQYALFNWPTLDELQTDSFSEGFILDTRLVSSEQTPLNDFACTLKPYENDVLTPLPLEILYILDTSTSIEPHRFKTFKDAIIGSMQYLDPDSKFNIAFLENGKVELLHKESVTPSAGSLGHAKRSLRKRDQSSKTHLKDLVAFLKSEKNKANDDITHHSCVLLSDGNLAHNIRLDQELLQSLSAIDAGNFSLYTASVSDKNNKAMLSLLAKINHGFSLYTKTHSSFPRKFAMMLKHIKRPLLHDIHISFPDSDQTVAYFNEQISPILLADKTFTFYGKSKSKEKARVFIQGKSGDRWINILKELPVNSARKARFAAHQKLAGQKSLLSLYSFLTTKDEKHLIEATDFNEDE